VPTAVEPTRVGAAVEPDQPAATIQRRKVPVLRPKPPPETRQVRVMLEGGARGGDLHIDGERKPNWLTEKFYELAPGPHSFRFVLSDPTCCNTQTVTKNLEPGEGPVTVTLTVAFRDALLRVDGSPGGLSCPSLFPGTVRVPGSRSVPMRDQSVSESCNYTPDSNSSQVRSDEVTLQAGQTTYMSVP
jgi:hypothetical protein